jgi:hypothetical protein
LLLGVVQAANQKHQPDLYEDNPFDGEAPRADEPAKPKPKRKRKSAKPKPADDVSDDDVPF